MLEYIRDSYNYFDESIYISVELTYHMDSFYPINYTKSIQKQRLVYDINSKLIVSYIVCYISAVVLLVMLLAIFGELFADGANSILYIPAVLPIIVIILLCWIVVSLILLNSTVKIQGRSKETNKTDIVAILWRRYKLKNLDITDENMIRDIKPYVFIFNGRVITCLFDNKDIYLNITSVQNYNNFSPFSAIYNFCRCKRIAKDFQKLQSSNSEQQ